MHHTQQMQQPKQQMLLGLLLKLHLLLGLLHLLRMMHMLLGLLLRLLMLLTGLKNMRN